MSSQPSSDCCGGEIPVGGRQPFLYLGITGFVIAVIALILDIIVVSGLTISGWYAAIMAIPTMVLAWFVTKRSIVIAISVLGTFGVLSAISALIIDAVLAALLKSLIICRSTSDGAYYGQTGNANDMNDWASTCGFSYATDGTQGLYCTTTWASDSDACVLFDRVPNDNGDFLMNTIANSAGAGAAFHGIGLILIFAVAVMGCCSSCNPTIYGDVPGGVGAPGVNSVSAPPAGAASGPAPVVYGQATNPIVVIQATPANDMSKV